MYQSANRSLHTPWSTGRRPITRSLPETRNCNGTNGGGPGLRASSRPASCSAHRGGAASRPSVRAQPRESRPREGRDRGSWTDEWWASPVAVGLFLPGGGKLSIFYITFYVIVYNLLIPSWRLSMYGIVGIWLSQDGMKINCIIHIEVPLFLQLPGQLYHSVCRRYTLIFWENVHH